MRPFVARAGTTRSSVEPPRAWLFSDQALGATEPTISGWLADGTLSMGKTLAEAAVQAGLEPAAIAGAVDRYNDCCLRGVDSDFEKDSCFLRSLGEPPFYVLRIQPHLLVATFCGLRIDPDTRVLDTSGLPVPGLYAAGEAAGGVVGEVYVGHGNSVTTALVFGRRAGAAATWAATHDQVV